MKTLLASLVLLFALNAKADIIKCNLTGYTLELDSDANSLTMSAPDEESENGTKTTVLSSTIEITKLDSIEVSKMVSIPRYQVLSETKEIMVLELNYKGTDGISDFAYPYSVKHGENSGGCESDKIKKLNSISETPVAEQTANDEITTDEIVTDESAIDPAVTDEPGLPDVPEEIITN